MSKTILIVEGDAAQSRTLASALEQQGFRVEETLDGKGSPETIRALRPDLVVMAVDLSAGQNGYILCGKLKKDDELKSVPLVIVGNPDGFNQHKKLKTRADDYVSKPIDPAEFLRVIVGLVGAASPEDAGGLALDALEDLGAEEISVDPDRLDEAFSDLTADVDDEGALSVEVPLERTGEASIDADLSALDSLDGDDAPDDVGVDTDAWSDTSLSEDLTQSGIGAASEPASPEAYDFAAASAVDAGELRSLRTQVAELQATLDDSLSRISQLQGHVQEMEVELEQKSTELVAARATSGGTSSRDTLAFKEAANRKDKEILRLKGELNEKDQEIVELRDREVQLEHAAAEVGDAQAKLEAQLQTVTQRAEQLAQDKRRLEQQVQQAQQEGRGAIARAGTLETELGAAQEHLAAAQAEILQGRERSERAETALAAAREELDSARNSLEAETLRSEQSLREAEELRAELSEQINTFAAEATELRTQLTEQQESASRNEERATRLYARIRADEKLREKTKKALAVAQQLLEEQPAEDVDLDEAVG